MNHGKMQDLVGGDTIIRLGNPLLQERSTLVEIDQKEVLDTLWEDLHNSLTSIMGKHTFRRAAGISGVQIGRLQRLCVIWLPESGFQYLANPTIVSQSKETNEEFEGCLSFFDWRGKVSRSNQICISYHDRDFIRREEEFSGWAARIVLHEMDHMDGILYSMRMKSIHSLIPYDKYVAQAGFEARTEPMRGEWIFE